jgi:methylase of polypeptide subunit release factors
MKDFSEQALGELLRYLASQDYDFVTPTPVTHDIVTGRHQGQIRSSLADVLGWNFPFISGTIDAKAEALLRQAGAIDQGPDFCRARIRVAGLHGHVFVHSGFPTSESDAVFFGPDSYRFADLIERELENLHLPEGAKIVDIGTGSGVGAIIAAGVQPEARIAVTDINPGALRAAKINAQVAGVQIDTFLGPELAGVSGTVDVALANPPYIIDPAQRLYRDGGGSHGSDISLRIASAAIDRLAPGGRLILYTGSAIIDGKDPFRAEMHSIATAAGASLRYREIDPDVFSEELRGDAYAGVERISVVAAIVDRPGAG